jgi:hypothetical protein
MVSYESRKVSEYERMLRRGTRRGPGKAGGEKGEERGLSSTRNFGSGGALSLNAPRDASRSWEGGRREGRGARVVLNPQLWIGWRIESECAAGRVAVLGRWEARRARSAGCPQPATLDRVAHRVRKRRGTRRGPGKVGGEKGEERGLSSTRNFGSGGALSLNAPRDASRSWEGGRREGRGARVVLNPQPWIGWRIESGSAAGRVAVLG